MCMISHKNMRTNNFSHRRNSNFIIKYSLESYFDEIKYTIYYLYFTYNMTGVTSGVGTAYPSGEPAFLMGSFCSIFSFLCSIL